MTSEGFQFFVNSVPTEILQKKDNAPLEYIIVQNDFLHARLKKLELELKEIEEENDRQGKSLTALRGITHNEYEMRSLLEQVLKNYKKKLERYERHVERMTFVVTFFALLQIVLHFIGIHLPVLMFYLSCLTIAFKNYNLLKNLEKLKNSKETEYRELVKNQDYIGKMIDSQ